MKEPRRWCARGGCRHAPSAHRGRGPCTLPGCECSSWADRIRHVWRETCVETWFCAYLDWEQRLEAETSMYETEMREWKLDHPTPLLKDAMIHLSYGWNPANA